MSDIITFPEALAAAQVHWGQQRNDMENRSPFGAQSREMSGPLWLASFASDSIPEELAGAWKVLVLNLCGRLNRLALWDLGRPVPVGTMRGAMTLHASVAQGATSMQVVAAGQNGKTLVQGDWLGLGSELTQQLVMQSINAQANASGIITVSFPSSPLRNAFAAGTVVTWDKPKALFRRRTSIVGWDYDMTFTSGLGLDLIESWEA